MITRSKRKREVPADGEECRRSDLPVGVFCHILSFLDTKYAVQTSVLSKKYKALWTLVPVLKIHSKAFRRQTFFARFVELVLTLNLTKIKSISFSNHRGYREEHFANLVASYATSQNVEAVELELGPTAFPMCLYNWASLKTFQLKTSSARQARLERAFCFPQLTTLKLQDVTLTQRDIFISCPNLVNMTLDNCCLENLDTFSITAPELAKLAISFEPDVSFSARLVLSAPKLLSFSFKGNYPLLLSTSELCHLDSLVIDVYGQVVEYITDEKKKQVMLDLIHMLYSLRKAKTVTLSVGAIKVLSKFPGLLELESSPFNDLKYLRLMIAYERNQSPTIPLYLMAFFHNVSPQAEVVMTFDRCKRCALPRCRHRGFVHS